MKLQAVIFFLLLVYARPTLLAQSAWNLEHCVNYSLENNSSLKNMELNRQFQQIIFSQARLNRLPQVYGEVNISESTGRTVNPETNTYADINTFNNSYGLNASLVLFSGFAQQNKIAFERYNLQTATNRVDLQKNIVIFSVIDAYFKVLLHQGVYSLYVGNLKLMQQQYLSLQRFIQIGRKAESDIYEFDAKIATDSFLLVQQAGNVEKSKLLLKSTMNFPVAESLLIDTVPPGFFFLSDTLTMNELTSSAFQLLPNLKMTENQLLAAKKRIAQIRGGFTPTLEMFGGWNTNYYKSTGSDALGFKNQFKNNAGEYIGLRLNFTLFNRFNTINALRSAQVAATIAIENHKQNIINFEREINENYIDWQTAKNEYLSAQKLLLKNSIAYVTAEKKMKIGQINVIEFYIQKNELLRSKTELLRTNLQLVLKERFIQFLLTGKWLSN